MRIEPIHIWRCIESGLEWNVVGRALRHVLHSVNFRCAKNMASNWDVEGTKAADVLSQLGVVRNKTIFMKVFTGMSELGYDQNNTLHGSFNSW